MPKKKGHWETIYVFDPVSGMDKPQSTWVEDEPIVGITTTAVSTIPTVSPTTTSEEEVAEVATEEEISPEVSITEPVPTLTEEDILAGAPGILGVGPLPSITPSPEISEIPVVPIPGVEPVPGIAPLPTVEVAKITPAPEYVPSVKQQEFQAMYSAEIQDIIDQRGIGIPEATQQLMIQKETAMIRAREEESLRVMTNNMERRGITNSGLVFSETQKIKSAGTVALANVIRDVTIKDSLMKMASFENAMGRAGQFLGYLAEESKMAYQGELMTWQAETVAEQARWEMQAQFNLATWEATVTSQMAEWQVKNQFALTAYEAKQQMETLRWQAQTAADQNRWGMENQWNFASWSMEQQFKLVAWEQQNQLYQMQISQCYAQDNMQLAAQLQLQAQNDQQEHELEMAEMEAEAANKAAATSGFWSFVGVIGGIFLKFLFWWL